MPGSEEFLKKFVVDRGLAPRERIADLAAKAAGPENASLATLLVKEGLVVEDELKTLLEAFAKDLEKEGNLPASESAAFGSRVAKKGLASPSSIWNAIRSQERNRGEGTEVSLDFFLVEDGTVDSGKISEVLGEIGRKALICRDCGRREIVPADKASSQPSCPECQGVMTEAKPEQKPVPKKSTADPLLGREIGGCAIEKLLGKGGMGAVYLARQLALNKRVAVKILSGALGGDAARKRFLREARTAARLEHPNVVQVYDTGTEGELYYIVMQYVEGESAAGRVKRAGPLPSGEAVRIAIEAAQGLGAAHEMGMIHRDVKPDNLLMDKRGRVKVADFGLAKDVGGEASLLTATGQAMGTPHFMSPEQARDASKVNASSDVYSLGATLFALLGGRPPYQGATPWAVVGAVLHEPVPDLRTVRPDVPAPLAELLLRMMDKDPTKRPADMSAVVQALTAVRTSLGPEAVPSLTSTAAMTLDDIHTPTPMQGTKAESHRTPVLMGLTQDNFPTPQTLTPPKAGTSWLKPALIGGLAVACLIGALIVIPSLLPKDERDAPKPGLNGTGGDGKQPASPSSPQPIPPAAPAAKKESVLEQEAGDALRAIKGTADGFLASERYPEAIAAYNGLPSKFEGTRAWKQADEEKARVLNVALARFRLQIQEMEKKFGDDRLTDAQKLAVEIAKAVAGIRSEWRGEAPEDFSGLEKSLDERRSAIDSASGEAAWLDGVERDADKLGKDGEDRVRVRLEALVKSRSPAIAARAKALLERFAAAATKRLEAEEIASFEKARESAEHAMDLADPAFAERELAPFARSGNASVRDTAQGLLRRAGELRKEVEAYDAAVKEIDRSGFAAVARSRRRMEAFLKSPFPCIMARAQARLDEIDLAETTLVEKWTGNGLAVVRPFEGEIGSAEAADGNPRRKATLGLFAIGCREVTGAEYAEFLKSSNRPPPPSWTVGAQHAAPLPAGRDAAPLPAGRDAAPQPSEWKVPEGWGDLPVTMIPAEDAQAYCEWMGTRNGWKCRLPSEDEWEVAAGAECTVVGAQHAAPLPVRKYPWGDAYEAGTTNLASGQPVPAGTFPRDRSPSGCMDMAGNVCEWCLASVGATHASPLPAYAIRGGCFDDGENAPSARCAFRQGAKANRGSRFVGFRVLVELE